MSPAVPNTDAVPTNDEDTLREQAVPRIRKRRDFHTHLTVYGVVNSAIWAIWLVIRQLRQLVGVAHLPDPRTRAAPQRERQFRVAGVALAGRRLKPAASG